MRTIGFLGAKGGMGTTTITAAVGILASQDSGAHITGRDGDMAAVLGVPSTRDFPCDLNDSLSYSVGVDALGCGVDVDVEVVDLGCNPANRSVFDEVWLVVRNDYMALKRAVSIQPVTGVVVILEPNRSLVARDVCDVIGNPRVIVLALDECVARAIDAGLLLSRMPRSLRPLKAIL